MWVVKVLKSQGFRCQNYRNNEPKTPCVVHFDRLCADLLALSLVDLQ